MLCKKLLGVIFSFLEKKWHVVWVLVYFAVLGWDYRSEYCCVPTWKSEYRIYVASCTLVTYLIFYRFVEWEGRSLSLEIFIAGYTYNMLTYLQSCFY